MKLLSLIIYRHGEDTAVEALSCMNLQHVSFFYRSTLKDLIKFHSRLIVARTEKGRRSTVQFEQNLGYCHTWIHPQGVGAAVLVDAEYPQRVAFNLLSQAVQIFLKNFEGDWEKLSEDKELTSPELQELFESFQHPTEADTLCKIEKDLEDVKGVVMQSMDDLLKRGECLDQIAEKSKDLSDASLKFRRMAQKNNQCCKQW